MIRKWQVVAKLGRRDRIWGRQRMWRIKGNGYHCHHSRCSPCKECLTTERSPSDQRTNL